MTAFPNTVAPALAAPPTPQPHQIIDQAVEAGRATRDPAVNEVRTVPRMSIAEMNQSNIEDLRDHFLKQTYDDRGPVTKFLDLLDVPRNTILSTLAPGLEAKARERGDTGTFGRGKVFFSDVLGELGLENRVAKGVLGFVGDVAFDPLTYLGGAGGLTRIGLKGGGTLAIRRSGQKFLTEGVEALARGGQADPLISRLANAGGATADAISAAAPETRAGMIDRAIRGNVLTSKTGQQLSRVGLSDVDTEGGAIGQYFAHAATTPQEAQHVNAVREFARKFAHGTEPSLTPLGSEGATSQIAHIPFTEYGVRVPALSPQSVAAARNALIAHQAASDLDTGTEGLKAFNPHLQAIDRVRQLSDDIARVHDPELARIDESLSIMHPDDPQRGLVGAHREYVAKQIDDAREEMAGHVRALEDAAHNTDFSKAIPDDAAVNGLLNLRRMIDEGYSHYDRAAASAKRYSQLGAMGAELEKAPGEVDKIQTATRINRKLDEMLSASGTAPDESSRASLLDRSGALADAHSKVAEANLAMMNLYRAPLATVASGTDKNLAEVAKLAMGTSDDVIGYTPFASLKSAYSRLGGKPESSTFNTLQGLDQWYARKFGVRNGSVAEGFKYAKMLAKGARPIMQQEAATLAESLIKAMHVAGVSENRFDEAGGVLTAMLYREAEAASGVEGGRVYAWNNANGKYGPLNYAQVKALDETGEDVAGPLARRLIDAERSGIISQHAGFGDALKKIAQESVGKLNQMGDFEMADDLLGTLLPGYVPNLTSLEARRRIGITLANDAERTAGRGGPKVAEAFQKPRSTHQYRFQNPETGQWERFFEFERPVGDMSDAQLAEVARTDPQKAADMESLRDTIKAHEKVAKKDPSVAMPIPTDSLELNDLAAQGRFASLLQGPMQGMFETNTPLIMAQRTAAHERSVARRNLWEMVRGSSMPIDAQQIKALPVGSNFKLAGGTAVTRLQMPTKAGTTVDAVRVGDRMFRQLDPDLRLSTTASNALGHKVANTFLDSVLADRMEDVLLTTRDKAGDLFNAASSLTNAWRTITLTHPSWIVNETLGHLTLMLGGDTQGGRVRVGDLIEHAGNTARMIWNQHDPEILAKTMFKVRGQQVSGLDLMRQLEQHRIIGNNNTIAQITGMLEGSLHRPPAVADLRMNPIANLKEAVTQPGQMASKAKDYFQAASAQSALERGSAAPNIADKIGAGVSAAGDAYTRNLAGPWFRMNSKMQDTMRSLTYLSYLEQGASPAEAAASTLRTVFDYGDLTKVEQKLRVLVPFYSWVRNNTAYQVKNLLDRPAYAAAFPKLKQAVEESLVGDAAVPDNQRPTWMRDALAVQYSQDPKTRQFLLAASILPAHQLYSLGGGITGQEGVQDVLKYFVTQTNPLLQMPVAIGTGRDIFSGREIGPNSDITVPQYLGNQIRPISEIGTGGINTGPLAKAFQHGPAQGVSRLLLGGKVQDASDERLHRQQLRDFQEKEKRLRSRINRANSAGDTEASAQSRAALLKQYEAMMGRGFADAVPAWAKKQLPMVSAPSSA